MSTRGYKIHNPEAIHFMTGTVHQGADVFSGNLYAEFLLDGLRFCQQKKGLEVYAWVVMRHPIHLILRRAPCRILFREKGFHPKAIGTKDFFNSKASCIHLNPVQAGIVEREEE